MEYSQKVFFSFQILFHDFFNHLPTESQVPPLQKICYSSWNHVDRFKEPRWYLVSICYWQYNSEFQRLVSIIFNNVPGDQTFLCYPNYQEKYWCLKVTQFLLQYCSLLSCKDKQLPQTLKSATVLLQFFSLLLTVIFWTNGRVRPCAK